MIENVLIFINTNCDGQWCTVIQGWTIIFISRQASSLISGWQIGKVVFEASQPKQQGYREQILVDQILPMIGLYTSISNAAGSSIKEDEIGVTRRLPPANREFHSMQLSIQVKCDDLSY